MKKKSTKGNGINDLLNSLYKLSCSLFEKIINKYNEPYLYSALFKRCSFKGALEVKLFKKKLLLTNSMYM